MGQLTNSGSIISDTSTGLRLTGNDTDISTNAEGGLIKGDTGMFLYDGTFVNAGTIEGVKSMGLYVDKATMVTNEVTGKIIGATYALNLQKGEMVNKGEITTNGQHGNSRSVAGGIGTGAKLTNEATGKITNIHGGAFAVGQEAILINRGLIELKTDFGVLASNKSTITNEKGGKIISQEQDAIRGEGETFTITNNGEITAGRYAVFLGGVADITNNADGVIKANLTAINAKPGSKLTNHGYIELVEGDTVTIRGEIINTGTIYNEKKAAINTLMRQSPMAKPALSAAPMALSVTRSQ